MIFNKHSVRFDAVHTAVYKIYSGIVSSSFIQISTHRMYLLDFYGHQQKLFQQQTKKKKRSKKKQNNKREQTNPWRGTEEESSIERKRKKKKKFTVADLAVRLLHKSFIHSK